MKKKPSLEKLAQRLDEVAGLLEHYDELMGGNGESEASHEVHAAAGIIRLCDKHKWLQQKPP